MYLTHYYRPNFKKIEKARLVKSSWKLSVHLYLQVKRLLIPVKKAFRCKECGTQLASKERLKKHQKFHKQSAWKEAGYVDPNNATYPTIANPTNSRLAFFISNLLGKDEDSKKKKRKDNRCKDD
jgi:hypothetical protein